MTFIYIDDYNLVSKIITYLDGRKINYTTDLEKLSKCDKLLISSTSDKAINIIKQMSNKHIIYILYPEELKLFNHINNFNDYSLRYKSKIYSILNSCNVVVTSLPYFKKVLNKKVNSKFELIPLENNHLITKRSLLRTYTNYKINKKKSVILVIDFKYKMLNSIHLLASKYQNINFIYLGYKPDYLLSSSDKRIVHNMPRNVIKLMYTDQKKLEELIRISKFVIFNDNILDKQFYLNLIIQLEKQLFIKENDLCDKIFTNSKNCYTYKNRDELMKWVDKYLKGDIGNLASNMINIFGENNISKISDKFAKLLR